MMVEIPPPLSLEKKRSEKETEWRFRSQHYFRIALIFPYVHVMHFLDTFTYGPHILQMQTFYPFKSMLGQILLPH